MSSNLKNEKAAAEAKDIEVNVDAVARIPGTTRGPASRAYLYYTPGSKRWAPPVEVEVAAVR